ncbi:MAG: biotin/lipoyl-containing protein [Bacteroidota bacterium]
MKAIINSKNTIVIEERAGGEISLNDEIFNGDIKQVGPFSYNLIYKGESMNLEVLQSDSSTKTHQLKINGKVVNVKLEDKYDELLKKLGMDASSAHKVGDLKAPMPGLVINIPVSEGDTIKKGDVLLILEAMKMENALKAVTDATVKKVLVKTGQAVEKNQVLIQLA